MEHSGELMMNSNNIKELIMAANSIINELRNKVKNKTKKICKLKEENAVLLEKITKLEQEIIDDKKKSCGILKFNNSLL